MIRTTKVAGDQMPPQIDDVRVRQGIQIDVQPPQEPMLIDVQPEGLDQFEIQL